MTVKAYISGKFSNYGINLSEANLLDITFSSGVDEADALTEDNIVTINVGIARFIPELLLRYTSVDENGFSTSWDIAGVKAYYAHLCKKYGLDDLLSDKPKATFL
ncbi:MAG: hypothetical protein LBG96_07490 [Tannerella sp.]|jgi:hypothetical protein|nr:hypothetical protein [Tannerella sp.]